MGSEISCVIIIVIYVCKFNSSSQIYEVNRVNLYLLKSIELLKEKISCKYLLLHHVMLHNTEPVHLIIHWLCDTPSCKKEVALGKSLNRDLRSENAEHSQN